MREGESRGEAGRRVKSFASALRLPARRFRLASDRHVADQVAIASPRGLGPRPRFLDLRLRVPRPLGRFDGTALFPARHAVCHGDAPRPDKAPQPDVSDPLQFDAPRATAARASPAPRSPFTAGPAPEPRGKGTTEQTAPGYWCSAQPSPLALDRSEDAPPRRCQSRRGDAGGSRGYTVVPGTDTPVRYASCSASAANACGPSATRAAAPARALRCSWPPTHFHIAYGRLFVGHRPQCPILAIARRHCRPLFFVGKSS